MSSNKDLHTTRALTKLGFKNVTKVANTLDGAIWKSSKQVVNIKNQVAISRKKKVIKISKIHEDNSSAINQNALKEIGIFEYLTTNNLAPKSIVKYIGYHRSKTKHYLIMEDGGLCLFDFVVKMHKLIENKQLDIIELHSLTKIIMKQMIEAIEYIHSQNIAHMDISLENWLINDMTVAVDEFDKIHFPKECDIQIKLCDFGLSEPFIDENGTKWKCNKYCGKSQYWSPEIQLRKPDFDAKSNDIFCLGVCFFMLIIGCPPWNAAVKDDEAFYHIMTGRIKRLLSKWEKSSFVNDEIIKLFGGFFRYEFNRIKLSELKANKWIYDDEARKSKSSTNIISYFKQS